MLTKRFLLSWIISSIIMFLAFYAWHGLFLTDFERLNYSKEVFLVVSSVVYLIIGLVLNKAYDIKALERFDRKPILRGLVVGAALGFALFLVTMVMGVSFGGSRTLANLLIDVSWQTVEQAIGGAVVGIVHIFVYEPMPFREEADQ
jgi:hypothetical protein